VAFERTGGQSVRHSDGYTVRSTGRETFEYTDPDGTASIAVDRGASLGVYPQLIRWTAPVEREPTAEERAKILDRVLAGLRAMDITVDVVDRPPE